MMGTGELIETIFLAIFIGKELVQDSKKMQRCLWYISAVNELEGNKSSI